MSRSGYTDDYDSDQWASIRWRGAVNSAIKGARGQVFLRDLLAALDAMPEKELAADSFKTEDGAFCTLGVIAEVRKLDVSMIDPDDDCCRDEISRLLGIASALAAEIMYENDEAIDDYRWVDIEICGPMQRYERHRRSVRVPRPRAAEERWAYMRRWVASQIKDPS